MQRRVGSRADLPNIAARENCHERYVRKILEMAFLAPDIIERMLDGRQPRDLSLQEILLGGSLPCDWAEQRKLLRIV